MNETSSSDPSDPNDKWIRVAPKKHGRPSFPPKDKRNPVGGIRINEPILPTPTFHRFPNPMSLHHRTWEKVKVL